MTDLTPKALAKLFRGAAGDSPMGSSEQSVRSCRIELDVHDRLLQQRQVVALEKIADALSNPEASKTLVYDLVPAVQNIAWEAGRSFAAGQRTDR